jgi:hypothetical protein
VHDSELGGVRGKRKIPSFVSFVERTVLRSFSVLRVPLVTLNRKIKQAKKKKKSLRKELLAAGH